MGEEYCVNHPAARAGGEQPLCHSRATVHEKGQRIMAHEAGWAVALAARLRAACAEQGQLHGGVSSQDSDFWGVARRPQLLNSYLLMLVTPSVHPDLSLNKSQTLND